MKEQIFSNLVVSVSDRDSGITDAQIEKIYQIAERAATYFQSKSNLKTKKDETAKEN